MTQADVTGSGRNHLDTWHVKLANGETRALSLDELDAGFHDGWITERTMVLAAGSLRWAPLGEVAGLDETPPPVASTPNSIAPLAIDSFGLDRAPAVTCRSTSTSRSMATAMPTWRRSARVADARSSS